jgi:hypothetical protein
MAERYPRVLVLNMASFEKCGGSVTGGSGAQEEELFRRVNRCTIIGSYGKNYPLNTKKWKTVLLWQNVTLIRKGRDAGYDMLEKLETIDIIAAAAHRSPQLRNGEYSNSSHSRRHT